MESNVLTAVFLPLALGVIMLGMGMTLTLNDFKRVVVYPKAVALGLVNQLLLLPIIAYGAIWIFGLQAELAVGLMILAACPGGATSNLISHLAKGDVALSITLTAISSLVTVISIPLITNWAIVHFMPNGAEMQLDVTKTVISVIVITVVPVSIGMILHRYKPGFCGRMEKPVKIMSAVFLFLIIVAAILKEKENIIDFFAQAGPAALALNVAMLSLGFFSAKLFSLNSKQSRTISIETGIQNGTLGITIAATLIGNSQMTIPSAIYSLIMFGTVLVLVFVQKKTSDE
ncbi:MAG: bile acid:sodium symporter family protein [Flavobacteriales bacterium]|nr:bile acid:sodium symporter family protein [Flavobacteriales bacterium]